MLRGCRPERASLSASTAAQGMATQRRRPFWSAPYKSSIEVDDLMSLPVRIARDTDMAFIIDAWKKSYEQAEAVRHSDREHYRVEMPRAIRRLVAQGEARIAYDPKDEDSLIGFAVFRRHDDAAAELHYVYVKKDFRGQGIARALLEGVPVTTFTFLAPTARLRKGWRHTPRFTI